MKISSKLVFLLCCAVIGFVVFTGMVFASHVIRTSSGATSFVSVNEDVSSFYNVSVNNTDTGTSANITQVSITLPSGFVFSADTNFTSAGQSQFTNTSSVLTWSNSSALVMNQTTRYFSFNATASTPGTYNLSIVTTNVTGTYQSNLTITVNDTTPPGSVSLTSPSDTNGGNISRTAIVANITPSDNGAIDRILARFYNSSYALINSTNSSSGASSLFLNFTGLSEGLYYLNATVNDTFGNTNNSQTFFYLIDTTSPSVSISGTSSTKSSLEISVSISESGSGIISSCSSDRSGASISGSGTSQFVNESSLGCGSSYTYNITCTDAAGNQGSASSSFSTSSCDSATGNDGSSSGYTPPYWQNTYTATDQDLLEGYTRALPAKNRVRVTVNGETHYVGVTDVTSATATINVSSTSQQAVLSVGQTKKFEVTNDAYYDLSVSLNSINGTSAVLFIKKINEVVPASESSSFSSSGAENSSVQSSASTTSGSFLWFIALFVVGGLIVIAAYFLYKEFQRRRALRGA